VEHFLWVLWIEGVLNWLGEDAFVDDGWDGEDRGNGDN
jgi:hypothetical protein